MKELKGHYNIRIDIGKACIFYEFIYKYTKEMPSGFCLFYALFLCDNIILIPLEDEICRII